MKVLFAATEAVPFCKTGGLADVAGALPVALRRRKQDVRVVLPKYRSVNASAFGLTRRPEKLIIPVKESLVDVALWEGRMNGRVPVYFIDAPKYFDRSGLYQDDNGDDYADNDERFVLFSRAILEASKAVDFRPDVVHVNDWQTGLVPAYLSTVYRTDAFFHPTASVFSIHNIAYQGHFTKDTLFTGGFGWSDFTPEGLEYFDGINFLKAGLSYAHMLSTVSPTYAREVREDAAFGRGMEGILQRRSEDFVGILNGLDEKVWDPAKDVHLARAFSAKRLAGRAVCKSDLQKICGFDPDPRRPLLGLVSRLDPQKIGRAHV
jgi:starch synthase